MAAPSGSTNYRVNTFMVNFSEVSKKPKVEVVADLIFNKIKIPSERVKSFQFNGSRGITYIECDSLDYALETVEKHDSRHEVIYDNVKVNVPLLMDDGATVVTIHDLPPQMDNDFIKNDMGRFGEVLSIRSEVWENPEPLKGIPSGVRKLRIRLATTIPSYVFIAGNSTLITYKNQQITCRHCGRQVHYSMKCSEVAQLMGELPKSVNTRLQRNKYADVVQGPKTIKRPASQDWPGPIMTNLNSLNKKATREPPKAKDTNTATVSGMLADIIRDRPSSSTTTTAVNVSNINGGSDGMVNVEANSGGTEGAHHASLNDVLMDPKDDTTIYDSDTSIASTASWRGVSRKGRKTKTLSKTQ